MEVLTYVAVAILSSLGVFAGFIVGNFAKEELKDARRYFGVAQAIVCGILFSLVLNARLESFAIVVSIVGAIVVVCASLRLGLPMLWYALFGVLYNVSAQLSIMPVIASLVFLYGLPTGSIAFLERKSWQSLLLPAGVFLVVTIGLGFVI